MPPHIRRQQIEHIASAEHCDETGFLLSGRTLQTSGCSFSIGECSHFAFGAPHSSGRRRIRPSRAHVASCLCRELGEPAPYTSTRIRRQHLARIAIARHVDNALTHCPGAHCRHPDAPSASENVPISHSEHPTAPGEEEYDPAAHM